jgi:hypothetical protein
VVLVPVHFFCFRVLQVSSDDSLFEFLSLISHNPIALYERFKCYCDPVYMKTKVVLIVSLAASVF